MAMILDKQVNDRTPDVCLELRAGIAREQSPVKQTQETLRVETTRFGALEVDTDLILTFADGMIGFEDCTRYVIISPEDNDAFRWLQSLDRPALAFPLLDPTAFRPDYTPAIADTEARLLGLTATVPFMLFCVVTIPPHNPREMTANLLGPLVINGLTRVGRQVIVQDEGLTTRHRIMDELQRATLRTASAVAVTAVKADKAGRAARAA